MTPCDNCGAPVDPATGYLIRDGEAERWFDTEACLAADPEGARRVSPGFGRMNVDDQPPMMLVPAPAGHQGPTVHGVEIARVLGLAAGQSDAVRARAVPAEEQR